MIVKLFDRQDRYNPLNGTTFLDSSSLLEFLNRLSSRSPFFSEVEGENGFKLLVGVGGNWSCIQHSPLEGSPPFLMAVPKTPQPGAKDMEFLIGNTPTPINHRYIIEWKLAEKAISSFIETGQKSELVDWEEI